MLWFCWEANSFQRESGFHGEREIKPNAAEQTQKFGHYKVHKRGKRSCVQVSKEETGSVLVKITYTYPNLRLRFGGVQMYHIQNIDVIL